MHLSHAGFALASLAVLGNAAPQPSVCNEFKCERGATLPDRTDVATSSKLSDFWPVVPIPLPTFPLSWWSHFLATATPTPTGYPTAALDKRNDPRYTTTTTWLSGPRAHTEHDDPMYTTTTTWLSGPRAHTKHDEPKYTTTTVWGSDPALQTVYTTVTRWDDVEKRDLSTPTSSTKTVYETIWDDVKKRDLTTTTITLDARSAASPSSTATVSPVNEDPLPAPIKQESAGYRSARNPFSLLKPRMAWFDWPWEPCRGTTCHQSSFPCPCSEKERREHTLAWEGCDWRMDCRDNTMPCPCDEEERKHASPRCDKELPCLNQRFPCPCNDWDPRYDGSYWLATQCDNTLDCHWYPESCTREHPETCTPGKWGMHGTEANDTETREYCETEPGHCQPR